MGKEVIVNSGANFNALTSGSKIIGKIIADNDYRIDGEVEGEIICNGKIIIGQNGTLKGTITCSNAEILGKVEGDIKVSELTILRSTSSVIGDIKTKNLMIEPNAIFDGNCSMREISDLGL